MGVLAEMRNRLGSVVGGALLLGLLLASLPLSAQDLHHSQFWMNPIAINPASAGFFNGDFRAGTAYRNQWLAVTVPYQTFGLWADAPVVKRMVQQDIVGAGVLLDADRAGDSKYSTLQANGCVSYSKALNRRNNHFMTVGLSLGFSQKRFQPSELMHGDQYVDGKYDPDAPTLENYPYTAFSYADVGGGVQWFYQNRAGVIFQAGLSALHLNRPPQSMLKDEKVRLPEKYTGLFHVQLPLGGENCYLQPSLYMCRQDVYSEIMAGMLGSYAFSYDRTRGVTSLMGGVDYRLGDALYLVVGGEWRHFQLLVSYDFNVSSLSTASHGRGGVEVNLQYVYKKPYVIRRHEIPCPIW